MDGVKTKREWRKGTMKKSKHTLKTLHSAADVRRAALRHADRASTTCITEGDEEGEVLLPWE